MSKVKFKNNEKRVKNEIKESSSYILEALARMTASETKKNILRGKKSGETYIVPGTKVSYRASAPGESPASRTGGLANSYMSDLISEKESIVYSKLKYARIEFGWGDIAPRPALRPAMDDVMKKKDSIIKRATRKLK